MPTPLSPGSGCFFLAEPFAILGPADLGKIDDAIALAIPLASAMVAGVVGRHRPDTRCAHSLFRLALSAAANCGHRRLAICAWFSPLTVLKPEHGNPEV